MFENMGCSNRPSMTLVRTLAMLAVINSSCCLPTPELDDIRQAFAKTWDETLKALANASTGVIQDIRESAVEASRKADLEVQKHVENLQSALHKSRQQLQGVFTELGSSSEETGEDPSLHVEGGISLASEGPSSGVLLGPGAERDPLLGSGRNLPVEGAAPIPGGEDPYSSPPSVGRREFEKLKKLVWKVQFGFSKLETRLANLEALHYSGGGGGQATQSQPATVQVELRRGSDITEPPASGGTTDVLEDIVESQAEERNSALV